MGYRNIATCWKQNIKETKACAEQPWRSLDSMLSSTSSSELKRFHPGTCESSLYAVVVPLMMASSKMDRTFDSPAGIAS
jgi:hypothetical protein